MSLDKTDALPVDTHVWQIAARDYLPRLSNSKNLTEKLYKEIGKLQYGLQIKSTKQYRITEYIGDFTTCYMMFI